ncbi:MAG: hypothetical protein ABI594_10825 [Ginsengibacter sp.]
MLKQFIILSAFLCVGSLGFCQVDSLDEFNRERVQLTKHGMLALATWGGINLLYSGIAAGSASGSNQYFHRMNLAWGGVNFAIGTLGYLLTKNKEGYGYAQTLHKQQAMEKIYLLNTGLDVAYIVGGFYFRERANNIAAKHDRLKGYGNSIILQGSALFVYDGIMYLIHNNHGKKMDRFIDKMQIGFALNQLSCVVKL